MVKNRSVTHGCLVIFTTILLQGCSPASVVRTASRVLPSSPNTNGLLVEPVTGEAVVVINNNAAGGNHAGIFAATRLNDPAGSYVSIRSQDKNWPGPSLADYVDFQKEDGGNIQIYRFRLTPADFDALDSRMASASPTAPLFCAAEVQNLIAGLGPFKSIETIGWTSPASLGELLDKLANGPTALGECVLPDNNPC